MEKATILVTGGAGFIGSNYVRFLLEQTQMNVLVLDKLTYAGQRSNLPQSRRLQFVKGDICNTELINELAYKAKYIVHLAAESHVDRSHRNISTFLSTNVAGCANVLSAALNSGIRRLLYVSTDEIYGTRFPEEPAKEADAHRPSNPYATSKSLAEQLVKQWNHLGHLDTVVIRGVNAIGPYQHPEKLVPLFTTQAILAQALPVHGFGRAKRDFIHVSDFIKGLHVALTLGRAGEVYNLGGDGHMSVMDVVRIIGEEIGIEPKIQLTTDRVAQDACYAVNSDKLKSLGWSPKCTGELALKETVKWYVNSENWWRPIRCTKDFSEQLAFQAKGSVCNLPLVLGTVDLNE